jgi:hypothetical protein
MVRGRVCVHRKGHHWHWLPIDPEVHAELQTSFRELKPELDDYVFVAEVEQWVSAVERERRRTNPKTPSSDQALWRMVLRVCARASVRPLSPHQLRHGFANRFLRESGRDVVALQALMGHTRPDTTQQYTDEVQLDELAEALERAAASRNAQASPDQATLEAELTGELERLRWRRRESNPRNVPPAPGVVPRGRLDGRARVAAVEPHKPRPASRCGRILKGADRHGDRAERHRHRSVEPDRRHTGDSAPAGRGFALERPRLAFVYLAK